MALQSIRIDVPEGEDNPVGDPNRRHFPVAYPSWYVGVPEHPVPE